MPRFTPKRYEQILEPMIARVVSRSDLSDISDTSVFKHILAAAARQDDEQYYQMTLLLQMFSIDTARGDDLDERAKDIQPSTITRNLATKANGHLVFSRAVAGSEVTIPLGTQCKTSSGETFSTTSIGSIPNGSTDSSAIPAIAAIAGSTGNVASGTIVKFNAKPPGVDSVTNPNPFVNGTDKETDDSFRARLKAYVASLARCTVEGLEGAVLGAEDENTGATILYAKAWEDPVNRGNVVLYVDDGTGSIETTSSIDATAISATFTWNGTTTVTSADTSEVSVGDFIKLDSDGQYFEISNIVTDTNVTILNPGSLTIPSGSTQSSIAEEIVTQGLTGPPPDTAVGGEETLYLNSYPLKGSVTPVLFSSENGLLVLNTDYTLNVASGQIDFTSPLVNGETIIAEYTYYTGLISLAQKIVDGDPNDRENYPGYRAAGVLVIVEAPTVLQQIITLTTTIAEGYDYTQTKTLVSDAIKTYVNSLGIGEDVLVAELYAAIMAVEGIKNAVISAPSSDVAIADDELARTDSGNITVN